MVTHIATCGDSFGVGHGIHQNRQFEDSFAGVFSSHFNLPQRVYARSGCCNFTISLQVNKIIQQVLESNGSYKPFVLVTSTYHERLAFPLNDGTKYTKPDLSQVEYLSYPPYCNNGDPNLIVRKPEFKLNKEARLATETISNITYYQAGKAHGIARLFKKIHKSKLDAIASYYTELFDTGIKHEYDEALYLAMHYKLNKYNIPHLFMGFFTNTVEGNPNFMKFDWGYYTSRYPDSFGSGHSNEEGNRLAGLSVIEHAVTHKLL
jgi:hypothetical protein